MAYIPPASESAPVMGLTMPPDRQPESVGYHLQQALMILDKDGEIDDEEARALVAFGQGVQLLQQRRMQRSSAMGAGPQDQQQQPAPGPGGPTQPYGTVPGAQKKPTGLSGGY